MDNNNTVHQVAHQTTLPAFLWFMKHPQAASPFNEYMRYHRKGSSNLLGHISGRRREPGMRIRCYSLCWYRWQPGPYVCRIQTKISKGLDKWFRMTFQDRLAWFCRRQESRTLFTTFPNRYRSKVFPVPLSQQPFSPNFHPLSFPPSSYRNILLPIFTSP